MAPTNSNTAQPPVASHPVHATLTRASETHQNPEGRTYDQAIESAQQKLGDAATGLANAVGDLACRAGAGDLTVTEAAHKRMECAEKAAADAVEGAAELQDDIGKSAVGAAGEASDAVRERVEGAQKAVAEAGEAAAELKEDLGKSTAGAVGDVGEGIEKQVDDARKVATEAVDKVQQAASQAQNELGRDIATAAKQAQAQADQAGRAVTKAGYDVTKQLHEKTALDNLTAAAGDTVSAAKLAALSVSDSARARVHAGRQFVAETAVAAQDMAESGVCYVADKLQSLTSGHDAPSPADRLAEGVETAKDQASAAVKLVADGVQQATEDPEGAVDQAKQQAQKATESAQQMGQNAGEKVAEAVENITDGPNKSSRSTVGAAVDAVKDGSGYVVSKTKEVYTAVKSTVEQEAANAKKAKEAARSQRLTHVDEMWNLKQQAQEELGASMTHMYHGASDEVSAATQ